MAMQPIVIRIHTDQVPMDWSIEHPDLVKFEDMLEGIRQACNCPSVAAFDYKDDDGDRITVRSEYDKKTMIQYYISMVESGYSEPLVIYPKTGKSADKRNKKGLKIQTRPGEEGSGDGGESSGAATGGSNTSPMEDESSAGSGSRKQSGDIRKILDCGNITSDDIEKQCILGSGNCGIVYRAKHRPTSVPIAVKEIPLDLSDDAKKQIISELEVLQVLNRCISPTIIAFYGAFFTENRISICTEWMDGGSLDTYGIIPENVLGVMAVAVVQGLQYLWKLKIMHRDVKPSNMLVNTHGFVKLCDFGVSIQLIDSIAKTFIGTNAYMAPERIVGQEYSIQSEVWSVGVSLFEMATGHFPYESAKRTDAKPIDLLKSIVEKEPPRLTTAHFSPSFVEFVSSCMMKEPTLRPAPHRLMRHAFIAAYEDADISIIAAWVKERMAARLTS